MLWTGGKVYLRISEFLLVSLNLFQPLSPDVFKAPSISHIESDQKNVRVFIRQYPDVLKPLLPRSVPETREELERQDPGHGIVT